MARQINLAKTGKSSHLPVSRTRKQADCSLGTSPYLHSANLSQVLKSTPDQTAVFRQGGRTGNPAAGSASSIHTHCRTQRDAAAPGATWSDNQKTNCDFSFALALNPRRDCSRSGERVQAGACTTQSRQVPVRSEELIESPKTYFGDSTVFRSSSSTSTAFSNCGSLPAATSPGLL